MIVSNRRIKKRREEREKKERRKREEREKKERRKREEREKKRKEKKWVHTYVSSVHLSIILYLFLVKDARKKITE